MSQFLTKKFKLLTEGWAMPKSLNLYAWACIELQIYGIRVIRGSRDLSRKVEKGRDRGSPPCLYLFLIIMRPVLFAVNFIC